MNMTTGRSTALAGLLAMALAIPASAQRRTEQFIPLGLSPGVSGISAYMGSIEAVDTAQNTVTIAGPQGERTFTMTDSTSCWLDRSIQRKPTAVLKLSDLKVGWMAEVKYLDPARKEGAEWIKVAAPAGS